MGTGDGAWVLRRARAEPSRFFVGIDANAENLASASRRAAAKPQRGGCANALFVQAAAEAPPSELEGLADSLTVLLPWGSLLAAVTAPDVTVLAGLARLCKSGAEVRIVFGHDVPGLQVLCDRCAEAGFAVAARELEQRELADLGTSWSGRLAHGRARRFYELRGARAI